MARKSTAALSVLSPIRERPAAPTELTPDEAKVWRDTCAPKPPEWFTADTFPLLVAYCRAVVRARSIAVMIEQANQQFAGDMGAAGLYEKLFAMEDKQSRLLTVLATKMRLSQQSKYGARAAETASRHAAGAVKPWEYAKVG